VTGPAGAAVAVVAQVALSAGLLPAVVLPDVGQQPGPYSPSALLVVLGVLAMLAVVAFTWVALASGRLAERGVPILRVAGAAVVVMILVGGLAVWVGTREESAHEQAEREYWDARSVVEDRFVADLEAHFGIEVLDPFAVSVFGSRTLVDVDRGDGPEECWIGAADNAGDDGATDDVVDIRCDGATWESATSIEPAGSDVD